MTEEQINTAIAEACGVAHEDKWGSIYKTPHGYVRDVPDYCNDLNAMHEAEKVLNKLEQDQYWDHLKDITCEGFDQLHSTARQRSEAFLRTIYMWKEQN